VRERKGLKDFFSKSGHRQATKSRGCRGGTGHVPSQMRGCKVPNKNPLNDKVDKPSRVKKKERKKGEG
jgi:hypothetical protein